MDRRMSRSMPLLAPTLFFTPVTYRAISPRWLERSYRRPRHYYVGGVRTQLIGADSYPNPSRSPRRLILCGSTGSSQKLTRSSSTAELSRTGVYSSREDLRAKKTSRRAASCEDVFRATTTTAWDSRLSESGVSLNDSRTDLGSCVGLEDVDGASQCSFGSSSAFHEITCDSEMDRPDSDCVSVPGSGYGHDRTRDFMGHDSDSRARRRNRSGGGGHGKSRHDSGSREKFLAELTASSGRSSPREDKEFYHSTPTKRGSPVLSIFPADEEDLHFSSHLPKDSFNASLNQSSVDSLLCPPLLPNDSLPDSAHELSAESLPTSPINEDKTKARQTSVESISSSMDTVKEALKRRRHQFFSSLQDCSNLEQQSAGESVQSWLTTGHPQRHAVMTSPEDHPPPYHLHQPEPLHPPPPQSPPSPAVGGRISVRDRVRVIEQGPDSQTSVPDTATTQQGSRLQAGGCGGEYGRHGAVSTSPPPLSLKEGGGASQQLYPSPGVQTAPLSNTAPDPPRAGEVNHQPSSAEDANGVLSSAGGVLSSTHGGLQEVVFSDDKTSTSLPSPSLSDHRRKAKQPGQPRVSEGSGVSEEDSTCLGVINDAGQVTLAADQLSGTNYRAVRSDDRFAKAGANTATTDTTQPLLSANTTVSGLSSAFDADHNGAGVASGKGSEFSDTHSTVSDAVKNDREKKDGDSEFERGQDTSLYHARPIQIVSPDEREEQSSEQTAEPTRDTVTRSSTASHSSVSGDSPTSSSFQPHDSTPSSLLHESGSPYIGALPDRDDAEVQSVLEGVNTQQVSGESSEWQQDEKAATDMNHQYQAPPIGLSSGQDPTLGAMTTQEVSRHHTRHVQRKRTTVEETVTTRRTSVRHFAGSPTSVLGEGEKANRETWLGSGEDYEVTDKTVSRITVTEQDCEREETTTTSTTRQAVSQLDPDVRTQTTFTHHSPLEPATTNQRSNTSSALTDTGDGKTLFSPSSLEHTIQQQQKGRSTEEGAEAMARSGRTRSDDSYRILDNLQEQLSVLSSENPYLDSNVSSARTFRPPFGYKDHGEASLPQTNQTDSTATSSSLARGTGSVFFTLDRKEPQEIPGSDTPVSDMTGNSTTDWKADGFHGRGSVASETGHDGSFHRAKAVQILPGGETVSSQHSEGRHGSAPFTHPVWSLTGSSSEINDSDDRCTSVSSHPGAHSDSDGERHTEEDITVHTFQDFLSGLRGQFTSDQPSLHRSVDMIEDDFPPHLLRPSFIQETILEADDENETTDEDLLSPTIHSFKSSLHFCVPQSTPTKVLSVSSVPQMERQSRFVDGMNVTSSEDRRHTLSQVHRLQDLSDKLSSINDESHELHTAPRDVPDLSLSHPLDRSSPTPSNISEVSAYSTSASAEVRKMAELGTSYASAEPTPTHKITSRRSSLMQQGSKKSQWVQEKVLLFQKLLNDFESQSKTSEQKLMEEMMAMDTGHGRGDGNALEKQSNVCDDLYRLFTREHLERRQNHVCPVIEDHMPVFRFKRFLRKKHNSKLKGHKTFRLRHQLERLMETSQGKDGGKQSASDVALTKTRHSPYHFLHPHRVPSPGDLRGRVISDVFTDDADVNRSISSDSAYSSLSRTSSRISDLDSTFRSITGSHADVSLDDEKLRSFSDVFDHLEICEGDVDEARLDRLHVGHNKAETL